VTSVLSRDKFTTCTNFSCRLAMESLSRNDQAFSCWLFFFFIFYNLYHPESAHNFLWKNFSCSRSENLTLFDLWKDVTWRGNCFKFLHWKMFFLLHFSHKHKHTKIKTSREVFLSHFFHWHDNYFQQVGVRFLIDTFAVFNLFNQSCYILVKIMGAVSNGDAVYIETLTVDGVNN